VPQRMSTGFFNGAKPGDLPIEQPDIARARDQRQDRQRAGITISESYARARGSRTVTKAADVDCRTSLSKSLNLGSSMDIIRRAEVTSLADGSVMSEQLLPPGSHR
jgi:hypothetical protein